MKKPKNEILDYHNTRLSYDPKRALLWETLCKYFFNNLFDPEGVVLELGAGYCDFINNIRAKRKIAIDSWKNFEEYSAEDVTTKVTNVTNLKFIPDKTVDFVFASNLFEHLSMQDFIKSISEIKKKLKNKGTLNIVQPNFRHSYREYFDDFTHKTIFTDTGLSGLLESMGFKIIKKYPKFLPLSIKSRIPVRPFLIRLYLKLPMKPLGKQMFIQAELDQAQLG